MFTRVILLIGLSSYITLISIQFPKSYMDIKGISLVILSISFFIFYIYKIKKARQEDLESDSNQHSAYNIALNGFFMLLFANIFSCTGIHTVFR